MTAARSEPYDYNSYSQITGPFRTPRDSGYQVQYVSLMKRERRRIGSSLLVLAALCLECAFLVWLVWPSHWPTHGSGWQYRTSMALVASIGVIELFRLVNVATLSYATLTARDPIPVRPQRGLRVAFLTSIVPSREPLALAEATLKAAGQMRHTGTLDLWLLDEGDDEACKQLCRRSGVRHFTRKGIAKYNQDAGAHKARTKHGNYNAWLAEHGQDYDFWVSVDTDHVPLPNFVERLLGYFRDPDVAFVVGPQVYGNDEKFITRAAESQQYVFHSVLQRAGNTHGCAMFVGTNNAMRISALQQIGGLVDSVTEDAATSLVMHAARNPETGRRWKSVYTPDVLAVGEGPSSWTDFFTQQHRWSRGTNEAMFTTFWTARGMGFLRRVHYTMLLSYYPTTALAWLLGAANLAAYLLAGAGGVSVPLHLWLLLYVDAAVLQLAIYFFNRRHNISPHEEEGSSGVAGMFVSVLSTPVYVAAFLAGLRRRAGAFVITPKGADANADSGRTFALGNAWGMGLGIMLVVSQLLHHTHPLMRGWALLTMVISFLPVLIWQGGRYATRWGERAGSRPPVVVPLTQILQHAGAHSAWQPRDTADDHVLEAHR